MTQIWDVPLAVEEYSSFLPSGEKRGKLLQVNGGGPGGVEVRRLGFAPCAEATQTSG
jgi:hypothetical protein